MKSAILTVLGTMLLVCPAARAADKELVKLTIKEEAGAARADEPVTVGVPFVEGAVSDVKFLALLDETGKVLPAQFTEISKWRTAKGGARWAHLDFRISVPANGQKVVTVVLKAAAQPATATPLKAVLADNVVAVVTGPVKFVVRGARFNGFDGAWFNPGGKGEFSDGNVIVPAGGSGGSRVVGDGKDFLSLNDAEGKVEIESQGPMKVVVKASGVHAGEGGKRFDYVVRFYAYANSPVVRVQHTFISRQGSNPTAMLQMDALEFNVPTSLASPAVSAGTDAAPWSGAPAQVFVKSSDAFAIKAGSSQAAAGKGKSTKPLSLGWLNMTSGGKGLACGLRWFWQMHPKSLAADAKGRLSLGLYPKAAGKAWDVYMGQSRTHDATFLFHAGMSAAQLNTFYTGAQRPLRPWASTKYYCRDTHCLGYSAESDPAIFDAAEWPAVQSFDKKMKSSLAMVRKKLDGHTYGKSSDSYGFYNWGDTFHWGAWKGFEKSPKQTPEWMLSWAGNYYDWPNLCLMQCLRTGDRDFYWHAFEPNTVHIRDVFTCQYHPKKALWGACRYCPPRNHVATDNGRPYVSNEFNHNKSQSVFAHWYLTGDMRTREVLGLMMNNGLNNHAPDSGWANRGLGAHLALLWHSWELTGEDKYKKRLIGMMNRGCAQLEKTGGEFRKGPDPGIGYEGIVYAHWVTGDPRAEKVIKMVAERYVRKGRTRVQCSLNQAYGWYLLGKEDVRKNAWASVAKAISKNRPKDVAEQNRNVPFALFFLSKACPPRGAAKKK